MISGRSLAWGARTPWKRMRCSLGRGTSAARRCHAITSDGPLEVRASLVVGADGRHSVVRTIAGLKVDEFGAPMDVLWFRLSRRSGDSEDPVARFEMGRIFIMLNRGDYWQCGYVIPKGSLEQVRERGLPAFRDSVAQLAPFAADRVGELQEWDTIKLLTVQVDRLPRWYRPGLLCIGDAAHAMSPVGGVGINLAIQDAVAAANILAAPLRGPADHRGSAPGPVAARVADSRHPTVPTPRPESGH